MGSGGLLVIPSFGINQHRIPYERDTNAQVYASALLLNTYRDSFHVLLPP